MNSFAFSFQSVLKFLNFYKAELQLVTPYFFWGVPYYTPQRGISSFTKFFLTLLSTPLRRAKQERISKSLIRFFITDILHIDFS